MARPPIVLREYEPRPAVALTPAQRDQLRRLVPSIVVTPTIGREGEYDLQPGSSVGVVRLDDSLELIIRPKLPISRVMFLISYSIGLGQWLEQPAEVAESESLHEAVAPAFSYLLRRALERGVLQGYREEEDALQTVKGRWRIGDQITRRYGIAPPVEVSYDDFTEDIELNRLLRAAIHRLLGLRLKEDRRRWALRAFESRLDGVRLVSYDARRVPIVAFDRRSEHYRSAVGLARLILCGSSFDLRPGIARASAFLVDMNKVFEDFVVVALRDALRVSDKTLVQGAHGKPLFLDVAQLVKLRPDISLWAGGRCLFVGDVKYKRIVPEEYRHADLYQLTAYAIATDLPSGMLIYAAGESGEIVHEVQNLGKRLLVVPIDLTVPPAGVLAKIGELARQIESAAAA